MLDKTSLTHLHISRFATILSRLATILIIVGITLVAIPIFQGLLIAVLLILDLTALVFYGIITFFSVFTLLASPTWQEIGGYLLGFLGNFSSADFNIDAFVQYVPHFLITGYVAMVVSLILFIISNKVKRSKAGITYCSVFIGVSLAIVLIVVGGIALLALKGGI